MNRITVLLLSVGMLLPLLASCAKMKTESKAEEEKRELRGVWITNVDSDVLTSRAKIAEAMEFLAEHHFNVVFPVVWNKSVTLYPSDVMEERFGVRIDPLYEGRDPLQELIIEAHRHGMEVIPWFEYGFASSYNLNGGPLLEAKPGWAAIDPDGNLVRKNGFEWMNALDPEVQAFLNSLILEVAEKYDVDGIQGDDRLPAMPTLGGYDDLTVSRYRSEFGAEPPRDIKDPEWVKWRADILSDYLDGLRDEVKEVDQNLIVSMSPSIYDWSLYEYLQDSKTWVNRGLVDVIHPQAYRRDLPDYQGLIDAMVDDQYTQEQLSLLYPGILIKAGSYIVEPDRLLEFIAYNRKRGVNGEVLFFYEGLRRNDNALATALAEGPYSEPAEIPYRETKWRPGAAPVPVSAAAVEGDWVEAGDGRLSLAGGLAGRIVYPVSVPETGVYTICVYTYPEADAAEKAAITVSRPDGAVGMEFTYPVVAEAGWHVVGTAELTGGAEGQSVVLNALESGSEKTTYVGPVLLLLNRKQSGSIRIPQ